MCIAIFKPRKTAPDWSAYERAFKSNPDGWGFAAARDGKLIVRKGVTSFNNFKRKFKHFKNCPALVHFRIKTSGEINDKNCHPFMVTDQLAVIHNGMLDIEQSVDKNMSDTWHFVRQVLRPMSEGDPAFAWNLGASFLAEQFLGSGNKMVFLTADGQHTIWNSDLGHVAKDRHWYSNYSYTDGNRLTGKVVEVTSLQKSTSNPYWSNRNQYTRYYTTPKCDDGLTKRLRQHELALDHGDLVSRIESDPITKALGNLSSSDYDAAQGLTSSGVPMYVITELYKWWPDSLENLYGCYMSDWETIYPDYYNGKEVDRLG